MFPEEDSNPQAYIKLRQGACYVGKLRERRGKKREKPSWLHLGASLLRSLPHQDQTTSSPGFSFWVPGLEITLNRPISSPGCSGLCHYVVQGASDSRSLVFWGMAGSFAPAGPGSLYGWRLQCSAKGAIWQCLHLVISKESLLLRQVLSAVCQVQALFILNIPECWCWGTTKGRSLTAGLSFLRFPIFLLLLTRPVCGHNWPSPRGFAS